MAREFEKVVELLSVHFNVDEDKAKRMVEYAFAKTENAGADMVKEQLLDYIKELELHLLDVRKPLPIMKEDIQHLLTYDE